MPPKKVRFVWRLGLKTNVYKYTLAILVWNWIWFSRELRECINVFIMSVPNNKVKKEK